jgi:D-arabinose 1-dehydrogenase-like Zn-dependent alcohol dehydrogenase
MPSRLLPARAGADGAGVVTDVGQAIEDVSPGAEVIVDPSTSCGRCEACLAREIPFCPSFAVIGEHRWGTHAEFAVVPGSNVVRKPADLPGSGPARSASSCPRPCGWRARRIGTGDRVLVVGVGGGSASAAFLVARALGAQVYATSRARRPRVGGGSGRRRRLRLGGTLRRAVRDATGAAVSTS